ncbi:MAG TPA: ADOP family duplicated permease [Gemmatimonadaceae bacterium]|jgi:predicted permease|nr:ADOP family duplicated permease [Gemmatimonadaceae bacterium]
MTPREVWLRLTAWMRRDDLSRELAEELQTHIDLLARDFEQQGMSRADAVTAARRQLGNVGGLREASRDYWGFPAIEAVLQDLRYSVRGLVRSPGFTTTVVVTLGLGIGANAAMFAVIDRLMFRPYPYMRDPGSVNRVYFQATNRERRLTFSTMPYTRYLDLQRNTTSFAQVAAISEWRLAVGIGQNTRVRKVAGVSASFFGFFDVQPARGRFFGASEDVTPLGSTAAVLSYGFWQSEFGGRDMIGEQLQIGAMPYTIIGVAPKGFVGAVSGRVPELFVPVTTIPANIEPWSRDTYFTLYNWDWVDMLVRRKPGVSEAAASAQLTTAYIRSRNAQRASNPRMLSDSVARPRAIADAVRDAAVDPGPESRVLLWVSGVAFIVLLIACANVANLMLARMLRRRREIALRVALGVGRGRLVVQFLVEGVLLSVLGGVAALFVAQWGGAGIRALLLPEGSAFNMATDWRTMAVAGACALVAALLTVVGPALLATRANLSATLKAGVREGTYRSSRLRSSLLVMQAALSVALLVGAGLFVRSLNNVLNIPLGYDASRVIDIYPDFRGLELDSASHVAVRRRLLTTAQEIPGVVAAARVNSRIFGTSTAALRVPGIDSVQRLGRFNLQITTPGYFAVMRTRILRGRGFDSRDGEGSVPTVVVSQAMARALWPGHEALGQCIQVSWNSMEQIENPPCTTVIGIAEDAAYQDVTDEERFVYYLNVDQLDPGWISSILVRMSGAGDIEPEVERVRRAMQAAMPGLGFVVVRPLQEVVDDRRRSWRLGATLFVAFGGLALVVAAVGLYGVIGYNVAQRMHELGVRIALGARSSAILRLVLSQGLAFAAAGVGIGLAIALAASSWLEPLLYKQSPRDPATYAAVGAVMVAVALAASAVPAFRAVRADPNRALRSE